MKLSDAISVMEGVLQQSGDIDIDQVVIGDKFLIKSVPSAVTRDDGSETKRETISLYSISHTQTMHDRDIASYILYGGEKPQRL